MDCGNGGAMMPVGKVASGVNATAGIFLHAGWRSCGTWMWERLRESARVQAFYEPLHEDLATLRVSDIGLLRPDTWQSGHGISAPYFAEYAPLLGPRGGVRGHAARFAFDDYFRMPNEDDAELEQYLRRLIALAAENGRIPVLKFCRSLGRVPWLEARFPDMFHAVVVRDPLAQWRSARRQMEQTGNRYFVVAPFVILARNMDNPLLAGAAEWLGVRLPPDLGRSLRRDLSVTTDACWRHVSKLDWQDRFRGFLALWVATGVAALRGSATLIDSDELSLDAHARGAAEAALASGSGVSVDLMPDAIQGSGAPAESETERADAAKAARQALGYLNEHVAEVAPKRMAVLAAKLNDFANPHQGMTRQGAWHAGALAYLDAAAYVGLMRATYPLRRAHFHLRQWTTGAASSQDKAGGDVPSPPVPPSFI